KSRMSLRDGSLMLPSVPSGSYAGEKSMDACASRCRVMPSPGFPDSATGRGPNICLFHIKLWQAISTPGANADVVTFKNGSTAQSIVSVAANSASVVLPLSDVPWAYADVGKR